MLLFKRYDYNPQTDLLGKGGFSRVYKALDKKLNRFVALKIYKTSEISERYSLGSEIQRVINLDHPNISRYLDIDDLENENAFGEVEKIQVCVMELLDGGNIQQHYNETKDPQLLIKLLIDVLNGLSYLHQNDIIHRDIKPGNILIKNTKNGPVAKITDFGISKSAEAASNPDSSSALIVSIPYMAPEQLNTKKFGINGRVSFNIDLWSLGVATYEIVSGDILFKNNPDDSPEQIMLNIIAPGLPKKIENIGEPFRSFVSSCIIKDASERANDISDLIAILKSGASNNFTQAINATEDTSATITVNKTEKENVEAVVEEIPVKETTIISSALVELVDDIHETAAQTPADSNLAIVAEEPALILPEEKITNTVEEPGSNFIEPDNTEDTQVVYRKKFVEADNYEEELPAVEKNAVEINNTDDTQLIQINKNFEDDIIETVKDNGPATISIENNTDDTQVIHIKKSFEDDDEEKTTSQKPASFAAANNSDDTQVLQLNNNFEDQNTVAINLPAEQQKIAALDSEDTQVLQPDIYNKFENNETNSSLAATNKSLAGNNDDTQILQDKKNIQADDSDNTIVLKPALAASLPKQDDDTHVLQQPAITRATPVAVVADDSTKLLDENAPKETPAEETQSENKILLFKRYEYYPNKNLIGKGGFSRVYKAFDKKLQRWVALKIYKTGDFSDRYSPIAEIQRVVNLDHSNICRYLDIEEIEKINPFGERENIQVCVMELLDSGNLMQYYQSDPNVEVFKKLLMDIFMGLSYLHKNGIIHRDIKPANILIKQTLDGPIAKITDFGISKKSDSVNNNSSSALVVSIPYMAPEQLNVKKYGVNGKISYNLDLWSLGVTIYEVLSGKVLFKNSEADNSEQIMTNIMASELPDKIQELPSPFAEIVARCIVKKAPDRAQRVEELITILKNHSANEAKTGNNRKGIPVVQQIADNTQEKVSSNTSDVGTEKRFTNTRKSTFYVLEDDVKGADKRPVEKKRYTLPLSIAAFIVAAALIYFFMKQQFNNKSNLPSTANAAVALADSTANHRDTTVTIKKVEPPVTVVKDSAPKPVVKENIATVKNDNAAKVEKQRQKKENAAEKTPTKTAGIAGNTYVLELNTDLDCTIKVNAVNYGGLRSGGRLKVWLEAGTYQIKAFSTTDNTEVYSKSIVVGAAELGNFGRIRITH